jgi:histidinol dehydrogenase
MALFFDTTDADFQTAFTVFMQKDRGAGQDVSTTVTKIIKRVQAEGDIALKALTKEFDRFEAESLTVTQDEINETIAKIPETLKEALSHAAKRIRAYHARQKPQDAQWTDETGIELGWKWTPVQAAGLYVPGGTASYPSSVLMNAIPAEVASVPRRIMCVPTPDNTLNPLVLYAAKICGITEIYRIGGAQAVAAMAYGTQIIDRVDVITGPGNAYVAEAKRQVFGHVNIDMIAGPSEVLVIADAHNDPRHIAIDLLSQAEHDTNAQAILITDDKAFGTLVADAVEQELTTLPRQDIARKSWETFGAIITVQSMQEAITLANQIAPEHLELCIENPREVSDKIFNAGSIFLGRYTPEALGDYIAGPNHVLPTNGSARFSSGLSVLNFMKRTSLLHVPEACTHVLNPRCGFFGRC